METFHLPHHMPIENYIFEVRLKAPDTTYVYALTGAESLDVHYVGVTQAPVQRLGVHLSKVTTGSERIVSRWVRLERLANRTPRMFVLEECAVADARRRELHFIACFRRRGDPVLNMDKTKFEMEKIADQYNGICLSDEYESTQTALNWQCKFGHSFKNTPCRVMRGEWCPKCDNHTASLRKKLYAERELELKRSLPQIYTLSR